MSTVKSLKVNFDYIVYGYIRKSTASLGTFCPEVLMHIILLYCYLSELLSQIILFITNPVHCNAKDIGKMLNRLRYYLQNHRYYLENHHQMHLWSKDVTTSISLIFIYIIN